MNPTLIFTAAGGLLVILFIVLIVLIVQLKNKLRLFTNGQNGASLESTMRSLLEGHETTKANHKKLADFVDTVHNRVIDSHRGFALAKYNAFDHVGGNQSFSAVFLDENGDGMVLSGLYSRERSNVFAKQITNFKCDLELTEEEKKVLKQAASKLG